MPTQSIASVDRLTVIAIAVMAYAGAYVTHEIIGHCGMAFLMGHRCIVISSTNIPLVSMPPIWKYNIIVTAGFTANFTIALLSLWLLRSSRISRPAPRYFLWLLMCVNLFLASTYIAAAPIIKFGDSYILIRDLPGQWFWRSVVALTGAVLLYFSFQLCRRELGRLIGFGGPAARSIAWQLVVPAYFVGGIATVASAFLSELDQTLAQLQAAGGTFGLTIWLLLLPLVIRGPAPAREKFFQLPRTIGWIVAGALTAVIYIGVLGPGISTAQTTPAFSSRSRTFDEPSAPNIKTRVVQKVRIPMRDKINLVADIIFPEPDGRYPAILIRTPYGRQLEPFWTSRYLDFGRRGYVVVVQAVRGREDSEGDWMPHVNERPDGYDTIDWISRQPWSNGRVGMFGGSYLGTVQWLAAAENHPALKCIVPIVSGTDDFFDFPYDHGILNLHSGLDWLYTTRGRTLEQGLRPKTSPERLRTLPLSRTDDAWAGVNLPIFDRWLQMDRPSAFKGANFIADLERVHIPALHINGWWDGEGAGGRRNWARMRELGRDNQWVVYGFWPHAFSAWDGTETRWADVEYGPASRFDFKDLYVRWFDTWLKEKNVRLTEIPRAQIFVTGANRWRTFNAWPPGNAQEMKLYLSGERDTDKARKGMGTLLDAPPSGELAALTYVYDPARAPVNRDINFLRSTRLWFNPKDGDSLLYQSAPLNEALEMGGPVELELYFSTSAEDTDFFALLVDIDERGQARALTIGPGKIRARYLSGWETPSAIEPEKVYKANIELWDVAHRFERGHRIGLAIRSEWFPGFARNLNTAEPIAAATRIVVARQTVYGDVQRPSLLRFRVLPR